MIKTLGIIAVVAVASAQVSAQSPRTAPRAPQGSTPAISGWVGITYSVEGETDSEGRLKFNDYPVVVSVEAGSPAARAGIAAGDTILAFNDRDLKRFAFPIRSMLQPGKLFVIRSRRGTANRVTRVTVAERPSNQPERFEMVVKETQPSAVGEPLMPSQPFVLLPGPRPTVRIMTRTPVAAARASLPLAGAELRTMSVDLAKTLGVKPEGLFIWNVADGTPARNSGLREGDVVLRAAGTLLITPQDLRREIESCLEKELKLDIIREKKARTVMLKW